MIQNLIGQLKQENERRRAQAVVRYRQILSSGDGATAADLDELRMLAKEMGKTPEAIAVDLQTVQEHARLKTLADTSEAAAAESERTQKALFDFIPERDKAIAALEQKHRELDNAHAAAAGNARRANEAHYKLNDLRDRFSELLKTEAFAPAPAPANAKQPAAKSA